MKPWWAVAFAIIGSLLAAGLLFLTVQQPRGRPVTLRPPPTTAPIMVHVTGAVLSPGLYSLPVGSRVMQAIEAAGGLASGANPESINLANLLEDGQQVYIPASSEGAPERSSEIPIVDSESPGDRVDINTASQQELETLPEIGAVIAQAIIDYRLAQGNFASIEDIQNVDGIGPAIYDRIKTMITVTPNR
jgi:competence protein ComEA